MKIIELFCGTKSISNAFKDRGHEIFTIDNNSIFKPDLCIDILNFDVSMLPERFAIPNVIWASPPCTCFSVASISTHWGGGFRAYEPKTEKAKQSIKLVQKTIKIIKKTQPKLWFIENPRGVLRKLSFMSNLPRKSVTYCQYGDKRMKPTDIWTNSHIWIPRPMCKNGDKCHEAAPRGSKTGTQGLKNTIERSKIPYELCKEIAFVCENEIGRLNKSATHQCEISYQLSKADSVQQKLFTKSIITNEK